MRPKTWLFAAIVGLSALASIAFAQFQLPNSITWHTYRQGAFSNAQKYETLVIETEGLWQKYWANVVGGKAADAPKNVDWAKEKLVAINLSTQPGDERIAAAERACDTADTAARAALAAEI